MTDKQIIVTFSDGYCIVLEDNKVSIRENEFTKLCIVVGNRTNELLEFVKNIYLDNKRKEQECEQLKCLLEGVQKSLEVEIEERSKWSQLETEARYELLRKEQECERLKDLANNALEKVNNYLDKKEKSLLYKHALIEIKEIIHFNKTNRLSGGVYISIEQILQKISEVLE